MKRFLPLLLIPVLAALTLGQGTSYSSLYVNPATGLDSNDGLSWTYPKQTVSGAVSSCPVTGCSIFVADGNATISTQITDDGKPISIYMGRGSYSTSLSVPFLFTNPGSTIFGATNTDTGGQTSSGTSINYTGSGIVDFLELGSPTSAFTSGGAQNLVLDPGNAAAGSNGVVCWGCQRTNIEQISVTTGLAPVTISNEVDATGNGTQTVFTYTLADTPVIEYEPNKASGLRLSVTAGSVSGTDQGDGTISGTGISGTVGYSNGEISVTFATAPSNGTNVTTTYSAGGYAVALLSTKENVSNLRTSPSGFSVSQINAENSSAKILVQGEATGGAGAGASYAQNGILENADAGQFEINWSTGVALLRDSSNGTVTPNPAFSFVEDPSAFFFGGICASQANGISTYKDGSQTYFISDSCAGAPALPIATTANGNCYIDGSAFPQTGAGVNTALSDSSCVNVWVPVTATSLSDVAITVNKGKNLYFMGSPTNVYTVAGIRPQDSTTDYTGTGSIVCPNGATIELANGENVDLLEDVNFATLTGTTNAYGLSRYRIIGCTWDGNKANNTGGWVAQLYGRQIVFQGNAQNGAQGGLWLEGHDNTSFTVPGDDDLQYASDVRSIDNNGDGIYLPQGEGWAFNSIAAWGNTGWGLDTAAPMTVANINTYLNTLGGCRVQASGALTATILTCSTATGPGGQFDSSAGQEIISSGTFAGCPPLSWGNVQNSNIHAAIDNACSGQPGVLFTANSSDNFFDLTFLNNPGVQVAWGSYTPGGTFLFTGSAPSGATCFSGTPGNNYIYAAIAGATGCDPSFLQIPNNELNVGGYTPHFPSTNGYMLSTGNTDDHYQTLTEPGCTTGAAAGDNCATAITFTWTTAFPDTNYNVNCTGFGVASGVPSGPYVVSLSATAITVNYFAITAAAAAYSSVLCTASER